MKIYEIETNGEKVQYVEIELSEGHFTSMMKSTYDEMIARNEAPTL
jgi:hypothetical protein